MNNEIHFTFPKESGRMADNQQSRFEKSLGLLTTRFVGLLQKAEDGVLDLKVAADLLEVRQKRRIYDITNVLEGIGLIEKKSKNSIQWKGAGPGCNTEEVSEKLNELREELKKLEEHEKLLDMHTKWVRQSIKNVEGDSFNKKYCYITYEDLKDIFADEFIMAVQAPSDTQLNVPKIEKLSENENTDLNYEMYLKSGSGEISVYIIQQDLAESYCHNKLEDMYVEEATVVKREKVDSEKKEEIVKPKKKVGRPPKNASKVEINTSEDEEEEEQDLLGAKVILQDVNMPCFSQKAVNYFDELYSGICGPLVRLSPPPNETDFRYNLAETEGVCDLFDIVAQ